MREVDDTKGTAEYLHTTDRTMEDWRYRRVGPPFVRVGRHIRYRKVDVDAWLASQTVTPGAA